MIIIVRLRTLAWLAGAGACALCFTAGVFAGLAYIRGFQ